MDSSAKSVGEGARGNLGAIDRHRRHACILTAGCGVIAVPLVFASIPTDQPVTCEEPVPVTCSTRRRTSAPSINGDHNAFTSADARNALVFRRIIGRERSARPSRGLMTLNGAHGG